jgi:hypothetical protein
MRYSGRGDVLKTCTRKMCFRVTRVNNFAIFQPPTTVLFFVIFKFCCSGWGQASVRDQNVIEKTFRPKGKNFGPRDHQSTPI